MNTKIAFIGAGNIVKAILSGVEKGRKYENASIGIFDIAEPVRAEFASKGYTTYSSITELVKNTEVIVSAVTPQIIGKIADELSASYTSGQVILSVVAGIDHIWYKKHISTDCKSVRCMPTLTAQESMGSFAVSKSENCNAKEYAKVYDFLSSCGIVEEIPENLMTEVVAFNGSAPGYFYYMTNIVAKEAMKYGFDQNTAVRLFAQTMKGSAETMLNSGMSVDTLEGKLRLPGGTTIAALEKMEEMGFETCLQEGIKACINRCRKLGKS
ncbi:MAG: pyrroline-5-carboxylate reductase dimerization domain-containing protein [Lachnospiraceae bacterium]|nr:pyrroline-5-carboxylate reductase dimerization domain-containing protein [Lachnospiraceae bacterium]